MSYPIVGTDEPVLKRRAWHGSQQSGSSYEETWEGFSLSKMTNKYNGLVFTAREVELNYGSATAELKVKWAGSSGGGGGGSLIETTDRWECPEPEISKSVFDHPNFLAYLDDYLNYYDSPADDVKRANAIAALIAGASARGSQIQNVLAGFTSWSGSGATPLAEARYMARQYQKVAGGQTQYFDSQYSLRHTTRAPSYWSRNVADDNVNCIYSPALFLAEVTDPALWNFVMPGRLQYKLAAAVTALTAKLPARSNYAIGWLKKSSGESTIHGGWMEISTSYLLDQWSTDLYAYVT